MEYQIIKGDSLIYEGLLSLLLYKRRGNIKYLTLGVKWFEDVQRGLPVPFKEKLDAIQNVSFWDCIPLFIEKWHGKHDVNLFLKWMEHLTSHDLYDILSPHLQEKDSNLLLSLEENRNEFVFFFEGWHNHYFSNCSVDYFQREIEELHLAVKSGFPPEKILYDFTKGMRIELSGIDQIILIPSIHFSPLATYQIFKDKMYVWYPIEHQNELQHLLQVSKAIGDEKRLLILKLLSNQEYSFTDILNKIGGAKGNVHHHLMTLRAAGLLQVCIKDEGTSLLMSTNKVYLQKHQSQLKNYLHVSDF